MPTYDKEQRFLRDWAALSPEQRRLFIDAVGNMVFDLNLGQGFRAGLRVKGVEGHPGVFEMTWSPNGRATFSYGTSPHPGDVHIVWRLRWYPCGAADCGFDSPPLTVMPSIVTSAPAIVHCYDHVLDSYPSGEGGSGATCAPFHRHA
jgi:hypothetical protein